MKVAVLKQTDKVVGQVVASHPERPHMIRVLSKDGYAEFSAAEVEIHEYE